MSHPSREVRSRDPNLLAASPTSELSFRRRRKAIPANATIEVPTNEPKTAAENIRTTSL